MRQLLDGTYLKGKVSYSGSGDNYYFSDRYVLC